MNLKQIKDNSGILTRRIENSDSRFWNDEELEEEDNMINPRKGTAQSVQLIAGFPSSLAPLNSYSRLYAPAYTPVVSEWLGSIR